jgi:hypothetical protein
MIFRVARVSAKLQVVEPIVSAISVAVMHVLVGSENAAKMALVDEAMFENVASPRHVAGDIAIAAGEAPAPPIRISSPGSSSCGIRASATAIGSFTPGDSTGRNRESATTCGTGSFDRHTPDSIMMGY